MKPDADLRRAVLLGQRGRMDEASTLFDAVRAAPDPQRAEQAWLVESELLMERDEGEPLALPFAGANGALAGRDGQNVVFGIRPEALTDPDSADRNARHVSELNCDIEVIEPAGSDTFAVTRLGGREIVARLRADAPISAGQTARLAFNLDKALLFDPETEARIV